MGVISPYLRLSGNIPYFRQLFTSEVRVIALMSTLVFIIFGGIFSFWYALEEFMLLIISWIFCCDIGVNEKLLFKYPSWCILMILGWFLYFFIANSTGSLSCTLLFVYNVLSIPRLSIAEMKYLLKISAHLVGFLMISSSSKSKIFPFLGDLSEKNGFTCFQNFLLSVINLGSRFS